MFAILEPNGEDMETRGGRSPSMVLGTGQAMYDGMDRISEKHKARGDGTDCVVPDSHSFRHILNTASCDEVALGVIVVRDEASLPKYEEKLRDVVWHRSLHGLFHWDLVTEDDPEMRDRVSGLGRGTSPAQILIVRPGTYGQEGEVMAAFDADGEKTTLIAGIGAAADEFFEKHDPKEYQAHVREGHRKDEEISQEIPYGEDRDGDGKPDERGKGKGKGKGK
ncbi:MAG: hypothetical protein AAGJ31_11745 [Verrucomicrobiota bacterium]